MSFYFFLEQNEIEKNSYKKNELKKGNFAGGAVTFKMEGLIQLNPICNVELISPQAISSFEKKNDLEFPSSLKKVSRASIFSCLLSNLISL